MGVPAAGESATLAALSHVHECTSAHARRRKRATSERHAGLVSILLAREHGRRTGCQSKESRRGMCMGAQGNGVASHPACGACMTS